ncbi:hypothetical protein [Microbacterium schleiferi]|uniref:hypothetical protein n=1 Tax=Microbacterium schleiferi TaxID=69362 RepID=UPI001D17361F|nr:hypothetical protein [Microbacterium schleiferi]MCC4266256.1 hypothetical protein [Microbacterium schleiferi]
MPWKPRAGEVFPSLGRDVAEWMATFLAAPDRTDYEPFMVSREQYEFLVRLYELDPSSGRRVKHRAVLQRPRGWGKSPFLAAIACAEALAPVVFDGWDASGQPVAKPWSEVRTPLVLVTAVTDEQTRNTWSPLLEMLREGSAVDEYDIEPMDSFVNLPKGRIEPRTSSARSAKGARAVASILDQTEEWVPGNGGPKFAQVLRNNATKVGGVTLESPNAFTPGDGSVAESSAKFWDQIQSGKYQKLEDVRSLLYDHREAPAETDITDRDSLISGLRVAYGDSSDHADGCVLHDPPCDPGWSPIGRIAADFFDTSNDPQQMRADFLNQITHASDSYVSSPELRAVIDRDKVVSGQEPVTLGFDGAEGRRQGVADSTVLVGYSVQQKHLFQIGLWEQPANWKPSEDRPFWRPSEDEVDAAVRAAHRKYNVVGFFGDPSAGWATKIKEWEAAFHKQYKVSASSRDEPIRWRQKEVSRACEGFEAMRQAIVTNDLTIDGSERMIAHFLNGRRDPRRAGYVVKKPDDDQDYAKVDLVWGSMFAFAAGLEAVGKGVLLSRKTVPRRIY